MKRALLIAVLMLPQAVAAQPDLPSIAVVECINKVNGHSPSEFDESWELSQAVVAEWQIGENARLAKGYHFIFGRWLGWHSTWVALVDFNVDQALAYETMPEVEAPRAFGASDVPLNVVSALKECGVEWGGYWTTDYPVAPAAKPESEIPAFYESITSSKDLLPPPSKD